MKKQRAVASENTTQNTICEYLTLRRYFFWRQNSVGAYDPVKQTFRSLPKYAMRGVPDIIIIHKGQFIGIEVKSKTGKQSQAQADFQAHCERNGGRYMIAKCVDDVISAGI
jgi:hypothetical protein